MRDKFSNMNKTKLAEATENIPKPLLFIIFKRRNAYA